MEAPSFTLEELARATGSQLVGDPMVLIRAVSDLPAAAEGDLSFLANPKYLTRLSTTEASAVCVPPNAPLQGGKNYLVCFDPSRTFQQIVELLLGQREGTGFTSIHPTAVVHEKAILEEGVQVGPYAVIDAYAHIGRGTEVRAHVFIGIGSTIGSDCLLHPHSVVREYCELGNRVILQPGAVIGSCGFGYTTSREGVHTKLEQLGNVILEDDVEIGANSTVDRARFKTTRVGKGTKIDNLVQIAHNVELGAHNIIAAQTGLAGSTKTGRCVMMGGQVGVVGHLEIADFVMIATRGGVSKSITEPGKYGGSPVLPLTEYNRNQVYARKLEEYAKKIEELEKRLNRLTCG